MFDTLSGLPVHPLVVHAVVVLGPLAALGAVLYAFVPSWRVGLRWPTLVFSLGAAVAGWVSSESGEALEERLETGASRSVRDLIEEHAEAGELASYSLWVLLAAVVVMVFLLLPARRDPRFGKGLGALAVVASVAAAGFVGYATFVAGHSGATAVWSDLVKSTDGESGDDD